MKKKIIIEPAVIEDDSNYSNHNTPAIKENVPIAHEAVARILENFDEVKITTKKGSTKQTVQGTNLPSGSTYAESVINGTGKKADLAGDIVKLVDEKNYSIKQAADLTDMSQQYAGKLYHKNGGKKKFRKNTQAN